MASRRVSLPGADEIFRTTAPGASDTSATPDEARGPTGRRRHDSKITVYVSGGELLELEQTRLILRGTHGLTVDRGRIVREAITAMLADFEARGEHSTLVRRLRGD